MTLGTITLIAVGEFGYAVCGHRKHFMLLKRQCLWSIGWGVMSMIFMILSCLPFLLSASFIFWCFCIWTFFFLLICLFSLFLLFHLFLSLDIGTALPNDLPLFYMHYLEGNWGICDQETYAVPEDTAQTCQGDSTLTLLVMDLDATIPLCRVRCAHRCNSGMNVMGQLTALWWDPGLSFFIGTDSCLLKAHDWGSQRAKGEIYPCYFAN